MLRQVYFNQILKWPSMVMSMKSPGSYKFIQKRIVFVITTFALTFTCVNRVSFAEEMSMDAFRAKFQESTGKTWESADSGEKRDFLRTSLKITTKELSTSEAGNSASADTSSGLKHIANVEVRKKFAAQYQKDWDDGTPEEQESFLREYKALKQNEAELERQQALAEKERLRQIEEERRAAEQAAQEKKLAEQQRKEDAARIAREKREAEKKKLADQMQKLKDKQEEMKAQRSQGR